MGMGVPVAGFAMGRPPGVADPGVGVNVFSNEAFLQLGYLTLLFIDVQPGIEESDPGTVVPPIFEAFEAFQDDRVSFPGSDISNNAAHRSLSFAIGRDDSTRNISVLFSNRRRAVNMGRGFINAKPAPESGLHNK